MGKIMTVYFCAKCEAQASKWSGRCLECGAHSIFFDYFYLIIYTGSKKFYYLRQPNTHG